MSNIVERRRQIRGREATLVYPSQTEAPESPWRNPDTAVESAIDRIRSIGGRVNSIKRRIETYTAEDVTAYTNFLVGTSRDITTHLDAVTDFPSHGDVPGKTERVKALREDDVVGLISHDFNNGLMLYVSGLQTLQTDYSSELADQTFNAASEICLQTISLLGDPFPQDQLSAEAARNQLLASAGLQSEHIIIDPSLENTSFRFSTYWLKSLGKNVRQNFNRASFNRKNAAIGIGMHREHIDDKDSIVISFLDNAGGYPEGVLDDGLFTGNHGYESAEANNSSTGIAMTRLQHVIENRYDGTLGAKNAVYTKDTQGALLTAAFPIIA